MGDFFSAGERYENRIGEYEVLEVKTPDLVIKYLANGRVQTVEEDLQERIVRNLIREREVAARPPAEKPTRQRQRTTRRKRAKFEGYQSTDFEGKIAGTSWRAKTSLGGVLAELLGKRSDDGFESWAPNRQTAVYLCSPEEAEASRLIDTAQFYVHAEPGGLRFGLFVQRPAEAAEGATAWDRLITSLDEDEHVSGALERVLTDGSVELSWQGEAFQESESVTVRSEDDGDGLTTDRGEVSESDSIDGVVERLKDAPTDQNLTLTLETQMSVESAIAAGAGIAEIMTELFERLMPLYHACSS